MIDDDMFSDPVPIAGLFLCASGSIKIMTSDNPLSSSLYIEEEYKSALNIITYLLYALEQPQWFKQYDAHEMELSRVFQQEVKALEREQQRSHLRVIDGGKNKEIKI